MADKIEFGKEEFALLIKLKEESENFEAFREGAEARIDSLEKECATLKITIRAMARTGSKIAAAAFSVAGAFIYVGYSAFNWLNNAVHWDALTNFFKTIRND